MHYCSIVAKLYCSKKTYIYIANLNKISSMLSLPSKKKKLYS